MVKQNRTPDSIFNDELAVYSSCSMKPRLFVTRDLCIVYVLARGLYYELVLRFVPPTLEDNDKGTAEYEPEEVISR